jgi:hypothetical protein
MSLALRIMVHPSEMAHPHQVEVVLNDVDGAHVTKVNLGVEVGEDLDIPPGDEAEIMLAWDFPGRPMLAPSGQIQL